mmetsp:Transcript_15559/g.40365  ORF Transcript_15559/g.40365 Transcript_15559/m.40365 type:complete len:474 (+) Transcript_15559:87-1508(+)
MSQGRAEDGGGNGARGVPLLSAPKRPATAVVTAIDGGSIGGIGRQPAATAATDLPDSLAAGAMVSGSHDLAFHLTIGPKGEESVEARRKEESGGRPSHRRGSSAARKGRKGSRFSLEADRAGGGGGSKEQYSTRNLYVSGLPPTTCHDDLIHIFSPFGTIVSAKAIAMKARPSECQGYGFVMFESAEDALTAVTELSKKSGLVVQFAKVSQRTKQSGTRIQDPTNLYFSNLPLSYDEARLNAMLQSYGQVVSCRILRDYNTQASRGVGFARMQTREVCENILSALNGVKLEESAEPLLCKFADSPKHRSTVKGAREMQQLGISGSGQFGPDHYGGRTEYWNPYFPPGAGGMMMPPYGAPVPGAVSPFAGSGIFFSMPSIGSRQESPRLGMMASDGSDTVSPVPMADGHPLGYMGAPPMPQAMYNAPGLDIIPVAVANPSSEYVASLFGKPESTVVAASGTVGTAGASGAETES